MSERARHGCVDVPGFGRLPALVDVEASHASAALLVRPLGDLGDVVGEQVRIEVVSNGGLLQVGARVTAVRAGDVLDLEIAGERLVQRRGFARVDAILEVTVAPGPDGAERLRAAIVNISGSGAVVSRLDGLEPGDAVELSFAVAAGEPPIEVGARVVRVVDGNLRAVHFERVQQADRERIIHFIFERQRLELQRVRRG